ncbi:MAG: transketolase, partial [Proteobacteria bacterium]|nr:transketolase [Pseudomonadota bacterium]
LGWPQEPTYHVPDDVRAYLAGRIEAKKAERREVDAGIERWRADHPERAAAWDAARERKLPEELTGILVEGMEGVDNATRNHSAAVLEKLSRHVPYLIGGSADLAGSAAPPIVDGAGVIGPASAPGEDRFAGQNIHFGIREHAMAAVTNGINLDGTFIGYCGTFLIFSDYMRPSIRLSALMGVRSIFVFTHDSIFLGEDGPTHQPIEQLDSLRLIPGLTVFRPADGIETAMAYAWILERARGPACLSLSRQKVAALKRDPSFELHDVWKGGYVVSQPNGVPDLVLLASGSEVSLVCEAAVLLREDGLAARVVSVPSVELFLEQSEQARRAVVPDDGTPLVAVEAGAGQSFWRLIGDRGVVFGMDGFGASAPYTDLAEHFGFTPEKVAARAREFANARNG